MCGTGHKSVLTRHMCLVVTPVGSAGLEERGTNSKVGQYKTVRDCWLCVYLGDYLARL